MESLSPHRTLAVDWNDELVDLHEAAEGKRRAVERDDGFTDFAHMILENLKAAGVQQAHKEDRITFTALKGWPGDHISAEGTFMEGDVERRAGVFIGPEFGTVSRPDLVAAAREAGDAGFDVLIACAFNYDAHSSEFDKLGRIKVLKARMNPDMHMAKDLKTTGAGNLFVIFGEPDIRITDVGDGMVTVQVFGVDVFKPQTGEVQSEGTDGIALWMLDTDYNEESFFVRHAYFLGANDPYKALKTTLKAEIDEEAWDSLAPVCQTEVRAYCGEGDQPPRRRGDESVRGGVRQWSASSRGKVMTAELRVLQCLYSAMLAAPLRLHMMQLVPSY